MRAQAGSAAHSRAQSSAAAAHANAKSEEAWAGSQRPPVAEAPSTPAATYTAAATTVSQRIGCHPRSRIAKIVVAMTIQPYVRRTTTLPGSLAVTKGAMRAPPNPTAKSVRSSDVSASAASATDATAAIASATTVESTWR